MEDITRERQYQTTIDIIERVAEMEEDDPLELPPLYESVDPDALAQLAASNKIQFEYIGYDVTVENGIITIDNNQT